MPDQQEIEVKFALRDPAETRAELIQRGAVSQGMHLEMNIRLDDVQRSLSARHHVLRLREIQSDDTTACILTVKTPQEAVHEELSARREIELEVSDGPAMLAALAVLGYRPYLRYEKRREILLLNQVEVALDEMPFGWFMELEGAEEDILALITHLGLVLSDSLNLSYTGIFENICRSLGLDITDWTFEALGGLEVPPEAYRGG